jgi:hypothetical protein
MKLKGDSGQIRVEIGFPSAETFEPPVEITNSWFVMSFYKRGEYNYEITAYLS